MTHVVARYMYLQEDDFSRAVSARKDTCFDKAVGLFDIIIDQVDPS